VRHVACDVHQKCIEHFSQKTKKEKLEDLGLNRRRILKWFSRLLLMGLKWLKLGFVGGSVNTVMTHHFP
jgi:hypothetical protein